MTSFGSSLDDDKFQSNLKDLEDKGFTVVENVFDAAEIEMMQRDYSNVKATAYDLMSTTDPRLRIWEESGQETRSEYWKRDGTIILHAGEGRYDLFRGFQTGFFNTDSVMKNKKIERLVSKLLVDNFTNYAGVVLSTPGSKNQYWHRDTDTLSNNSTDGKCLMAVDDFYFTCLIPITEDVTLENGATEFRVQSHRKTSEEFDGLSLERKCCPLGSALLFNGKIHHRGTENKSARDRPCIYSVYHKKWYNDNFRRGVDED
jgi:ectoine hydroxylase-related dioxygenase (phytanoyl-CoA dioxygenase family)